MPGLPRRRISPRSLALVAAAAVAAGVWIWRSGGDVTAAEASTVDAQDGGVTLTAAIVAPANTTPAPAPTSTTAHTTKKPPMRPHPVVRPTPPPALPAPAPAAPKKTVEARTPAPADSPAEPPADDTIDPDRVSSSIKDLIGNAPKPDLDP